MLLTYRHEWVSTHVSVLPFASHCIASIVEMQMSCVLIFESSLTFKPYITYLKAKCLKALNLRRVVTHTGWGADYTAVM